MKINLRHFKEFLDLLGHLVYPYEKWGGGGRESFGAVLIRELAVLAILNEGEKHYHPLKRGRAKSVTVLGGGLKK